MVSSRSQGLWEKRLDHMEDAMQQQEKLQDWLHIRRDSARKTEELQRPPDEPKHELQFLLSIVAFSSIPASKFLM